MYYILNLEIPVKLFKEEMLPFRDDDFWTRIVLTPNKAEFTSLPTRMVMMRVALLTRVLTPKNIEDAKDIIYSFFSANEEVLVEDIEILIREYGRK